MHIDEQFFVTATSTCFSMALCMGRAYMFPGTAQLHQYLARLKKMCTPPRHNKRRHQSMDMAVSLL